MTRTAISPRLATRTLANMRARHAIRPPVPGTPRTIDLQRRRPAPGPGRSTAFRGRARARRERWPPRCRGSRTCSRATCGARRETAALLGYPDATPDPRWREIDVGDWAGRPLTEFPSGTEPAWRGGPLAAPGGETWDDLVARVGAAVDELRAATGWSSATAASSAPRSRTSPAPIRAGSQGPANASVTVISGGSLRWATAGPSGQGPDRRRVSASSALGRRWSPYAALILGPLQGGSNGNRPAGTMGPPCRPVTPKPRARGPARPLRAARPAPTG